MSTISWLSMHGSPLLQTSISCYLFFVMPVYFYDEEDFIGESVFRMKDEEVEYSID